MSWMRDLSLCACWVALLLANPVLGQDTPLVVNDITQLNPVAVQSVIQPRRVEEIQQAVAAHPGPISIGGGRYSMGGQTATENSLHIDMRTFDSILAFDPIRKEITVQTGITWRKVQAFIDPYDLSVRIMQTYANFTVGGSLSVNVHGRYIGLGPLILSVKQIKIVLADGSLKVASPTQHKEIFYAAIGGYGGIGVITEATLQLTDNCKVRRTDHTMPLSAYYQYFKDSVRDRSEVVFHNADIYPNRYRKVCAISYSKTEEPLTDTFRLKPQQEQYRFNQIAFGFISEMPGGKWVRQHCIDPVLLRGNPVSWRNHEASYDVRELEPKSRKRSTYVLQEYFVPVDSFDVFCPRMAAVLRKNKVNVLNISIRHALPDPGSTMAWARTEVFAFVIYYKQGTREKDRQKVAYWTRELTDVVLQAGGTYYLPYQPHATQEQFMQAYPNAETFFRLKRELDPQHKFSNKLWDKYFRP